MKRFSILPALLAMTCAAVYAQEAEETAPQASEPEAGEQGAAVQENVQALAQGEAPPPLNPEDPLSFTSEEFMEADTDGNGLIDIDEALVALPMLSFEDANGDGYLNHAEVDSAVEDLELSIEGAGTYSVVGESDFLRIVRTVEDNVLEEDV